MDIGPIVINMSGSALSRDDAVAIADRVDQEIKRMMSSSPNYHIYGSLELTGDAKPKRTVIFQYDLDEVVRLAPFEHETGVITMLGYDDGGPKYYIQTKNNCMWLKESQIFMADD